MQESTSHTFISSLVSAILAPLFISHLNQLLSPAYLFPVFLE